MVLPPPQAPTKLGPILWLLYYNDLDIKGCSKVQYAADTAVYKAIKTTNNTNIGEAIEQANMWSINNNMLLNQSKTTILNVALSENKLSDKVVQQTSPSNTAKFLV